MRSDTVKYYAHVQSLVAEMLAYQAEFEMMKRDPKYSNEDFQKLKDKLLTLSNMLKYA